MNQDQIEEISNLPFIKRFVYESMMFVKKERIKPKEQTVVHADLIPKVSKKVMLASMMEKTIHPRRTFLPTVPPTYQKVEEKPGQINQKIVSPMPKRQIITQRPPVQRPPVQRPHQFIPQNQISPHGPPTEGTEILEGYGKITPFLREKTISSIECLGPGVPITIVKMGQRQITNITLTPEEIRGILDEVATESHIPLLEGVFRAAVEEFSISAVISRIVGSKFIIKKNTPYAMLEGRP
jgi:hypothetical protein|tara:strand:+ start:279 stop:995 length:717 start_codon:yes stop_codon:yes gene_type:complete